MGFLGSGKLACVQPGTVLISNWKHPTVTKLHSGKDLVLQSQHRATKLARGVCIVVEVAAGRGTRNKTRAVWWHRGMPCPHAAFAPSRETLRVRSGRVQRVLQLPLLFPQQIPCFSLAAAPQGCCRLRALITTRLGSWEWPVIHREAVPVCPSHGPATPGCGGLEIAIKSGPSHPSAVMELLRTSWRWC